MAQQRPSAAVALYPHLKSGDQVPKQQGVQQSLADALHPSLSARQKKWDEARERDRQSLLKHLRELNGKIDRRTGGR